MFGISRANINNDMNGTVLLDDGMYTRCWNRTGDMIKFDSKVYIEYEPNKSGIGGNWIIKCAEVK